ncbi:MAG TPA: ABC transporter ATP-binding protein, partial [Nitrolancea sp.]|nr:ABC transporter ATP-binding protein [Nitrolancea sp.]
MREPAADFVIETDRLTKHYGAVVAVEELSLRVPAGGVFGLLGPNGSGKTTTIGMLLGLVRPTGGTIHLFGHPQGGVTEADLHRIGAIVETPTFYPYLSGRANLRFFQAIGSHDGAGELDSLLALVELAGAADRPYRTYSLGMKQRLGIAYALLGNPDLVFLDEPTNGLDPAGVVEVRDLIRRLGSDGRTVILSSHLLGEVQQVCDQVAILSHGHLLVSGKVSDLLQQQGGLRLTTTDNARAHDLLAALPFVHGVRPSGEQLIVSAPPERAWEITRALAEAGVYVA